MRLISATAWVSMTLSGIAGVLIAPDYRSANRLTEPKPAYAALILGDENKKTPAFERGLFVPA
jgi:hypothetical protein